MVSDSPLFRIGQPNDQNSSVSSWPELPNVGKIEILSNDESIFRLCGRPHLGITSPAQLLREDRVDVKPKRSQPRRDRARDVLVELQLHATFTSGGIGLGAGRSSLAEAAAKAITARTSSSVRLGNSLNVVAVVSPWAR